MTRMLSNTDPGLRGAWHVVASSRDVGEAPLAVTLLGEHWVVARLASGLAAFPDQCPHRLAPLSAGRVEGDVLRCGYHGWCFDGAGACAEIPSLGAGEHRPPRAQLCPAAGVCEADGFVFLALDPPRNRLLSVPDAWGPDFQRGYLHSSSVAVGAGLMLDNFLDLSHFPFVHAATIGTDHATRFDMEIERHPTGMRVWSEHLFPNSEDPAVARGERPLLQSRRLTYTYEAPFSVCLRIDYVEAGGTNILSFHVQPIDDQTCSLYTLVARNDLAGDEQRMAQALAFEQRVIDEDVRLQTRYRDKRLPLDVTREVHVKVDRMTVELRRILADFVAHPGEASRTRNSRDPSTRVPARP